MTTTQILYPITLPDNTLGQALLVSEIDSNAGTVTTEWGGVLSSSNTLIIADNYVDLPPIPNLIDTVYPISNIQALTVDVYGRITAIETTNPPTPPDPPIPGDPIIAGYVDSTSIGSVAAVNLQTAVTDGYSGIMIHGFGWVGPSNNPRLNPNGQIPAYTDAYIPQVQYDYPYKNTVIEKVAQAKDAGILFNFLSFGGSAQSFMAAGPTSQSSVNNTWTYSDLQTLAQNMATLAHSVGCNGIDFDFEFGVPTTNPDEAHPNYVPYFYTASDKNSYSGLDAVQWFIYDLATEIQDYAILQSWGDFYVTIAPQVNRNIQDTAYVFVSTSWDQIFDKAIQAESFDYIFAQFYNTPPQQKPSYATDVWADLVTALGGASTSIIAGYPATEGSATNATIYHYNPNNPDIPNPDIHRTTTEALGLISETLTTLNNVTTYPNFGGVFCWSVNNDYYQNSNPGAFVQTMKGILYP